MTNPFHATALGLTLLLAGALAAPAPATATEHTAKTVKVKKRAGKTKFDKGSGETTAERERRLARECKGLPNAGACLGFGS